MAFIHRLVPATAALFLAGAVIAAQTGDDPGILTPPAPREPRINGPSVYGTRPGRPFLYRIPATGDRPMQFSVKGLPAGLTLDATTGIIRGTIADRTPRAHPATIGASNARGRATRPFRIVVGDTLALTPPMGWNDWYTFYEHPSDGLMRKAADVMIASGLADHGYQYVNIDDSWMGKPKSDDPDLQIPARDERGMINPNRRFPDMKSMTDYIHGLGLKAGLYTSPGRERAPVSTGRSATRRRTRPGSPSGDSTSSSTTGARTTRWPEGLGSGRRTPAETVSADGRRPGAAAARHRLQPVPVRDGRRLDVGRRGRWAFVADHGRPGAGRDQRLPGFYSIGFKNAEHARYARPGRWNDPDYILIGYVGNARSINDPPKPTALTQHEQYFVHVDVGPDGRPALLSATSRASIRSRSTSSTTPRSSRSTRTRSAGRRASFERRTMNSCWPSRWKTGRWRSACSTCPRRRARSRSRPGYRPRRQPSAARARPLAVDGRGHGCGPVHRTRGPSRRHAGQNVAGSIGRQLRYTLPHDSTCHRSPAHRHLRARAGAGAIRRERREGRRHRREPRDPAGRQGGGPAIDERELLAGVSEPGRIGHVCFVTSDITGDGPTPDDVRLAFTDNEKLAEYVALQLMTAFDKAYGEKPFPVRRARFERKGDTATAWTESLAADGYRSSSSGATCSSRLPSRARPASRTTRTRSSRPSSRRRSADVIINGQRAAGQATPRMRGTRQSSSAFLAFAETWLK